VADEVAAAGADNLRASDRRHLLNQSGERQPLSQTHSKSDHESVSLEIMTAVHFAERPRSQARAMFRARAGAFAPVFPSTWASPDCHNSRTDPFRLRAARSPKMECQDAFNTPSHLQSKPPHVHSPCQVEIRGQSGIMSSQLDFWKWFEAHEDELFNFESNPEAILDELSHALQLVDPDLTFEIGPKINGPREFVISAGGIKRAFPSVQGLAAAAPRLRRWRITAFRPRLSELSVIETGGKRLSSDEIKFSLLHNGKTVGIHLFIPGYSENDFGLKQIGYLFLDEALGEFDVETKLGLIKMLPAESTATEERYPLNELPQKFDQLFASLQKATEC
jgi:hypothetical protein